jgi:hypothetical protein
MFFSYTLSGIVDLERRPQKAQNMEINVSGAMV